jgi:hypothetical protein
MATNVGINANFDPFAPSKKAIRVTLYKKSGRVNKFPANQK